ncbi:hypothetical protein SOVF_212310, partial [Spinacia oleracea]
FVLLGIEARGFIFDRPISLAIDAKFVPLRKPRKLHVTYYQSASDDVGKKKDP